MTVVLFALVVLLADFSAWWAGRHATVRFSSLGFVCVPLIGVVLGATMLSKFADRQTDQTDDGVLEAGARLIFGLLMCGASILYPLFDNPNERRLRAFQKAVQEQVSPEQLQTWATAVLAAQTTPPQTRVSVPSFLQNVDGFKSSPRVRVDGKALIVGWADYTVVIGPPQPNTFPDEFDWKPGIRFSLMMR